MAKLKLAAQIKQALSNVVKFDQHPMQNAEDADKVNYLKAVSLMIHADQSKHEDEVTYFSTLVRTINPEEMTLDELLAFAETPNLSACSSIMETLRKEEHNGIVLLTDMTMLAASDGGISDEEKALIGSCRGFLGWDHTIFNRWYRCCEDVATKEQGDSFDRAYSKLPNSATDHILQYRGFKRNTVSQALSNWAKESLRSDLPSEWEIHELQTLAQMKAEDQTAGKLKSAIESIATLSTHPLMDASIEDKMNYLKALSLVMAADEQIVDQEKAFFGALTRTLVGQNALEALLAYAEEPDLSEIPAMIETLGKSETYKVVFLLDAMMLAHADGEYAEDESDVIEQFREFLGWDIDYFRNILKLLTPAIVLPESNLLNLLYGRTMDIVSSHIFEFRGVNLDLINDLVAWLDLRFVAPPHISYGELINSSLILDRYVNVYEFVFFMQTMHDIGRLKIEGDIVSLRTGEEIVSIGSNSFNYENGLFTVSDEGKADHVQSISPLAAELFCDWLSGFSEDSYELMTFKPDSDGDVSVSGIIAIPAIAKVEKYYYLQNSSYTKCRNYKLESTKIANEAGFIFTRSNSKKERKNADSISFSFDLCEILSQK